MIGAVDVVVTNNGAVSLPATAQMQALAPAFFTFLGTNYAVGSRLPGYVVVGEPSAPVKAGDLVVLWGTGFGPTTPSVQAGVPVSGAPATATLPVVTVGGKPAQVVSSVLTTGSAGLYQLTIQVPAGLTSGPAALEASIGGAKTQANLTIYVGVD